MIKHSLPGFALTLLAATLLAACSSTPVQKPTQPSAEAAEPDLLSQLKQRMSAPVVRKEKEQVVTQAESQTSYVPTLNAAELERQQQAQAVIAPYQKALESMRNDKLDEALQQFEDISFKAPKFSGPLVNQGLIYMKRQKFAEAEKVLQNAVNINDKNPFAWNQLGIALREQGKFAEAKTAYEKALELDDRYAKAHFNLGVLCDLYLQDLPIALAHYEKYQALQTKPDPAVANWIVDLQKRTGVWKPPAPKAAPAPEAPTATEQPPASTEAPSPAAPSTAPAQS